MLLFCLGIEAKMKSQNNCILNERMRMISLSAAPDEASVEISIPLDIS